MSADGSVDQVDDLVRALAPEVPAPGPGSGGTVLVTGPWLAGSTSLAAALRTRMPDVVFAEPDELAQDDVPVVVVFVVSAAAPVALSDCALLDAAAARTDAVVGVVTKIDVHKRWREVLEADSSALRQHSARYRQMPWVGVAAAPQLGEPQLDGLVAELRDQLADPDLVRRNRLRHWEYQLLKTRSSHDDAADDREVAAQRLRRRRAELLRESRLDRGQRTIALRSKIQQARVQLSYFGRSRCASVLSELHDDAAAMTRRRLPAFGPYVARRVDEVVGEVDEGVTEHLADVAHELKLPPVPPGPVAVGPVVGQPPLRSRRLEMRLVLLLGAGFGLGVALTLIRLLADLAPGFAVGGVAVCVLVGLAVTVWVVGTRGLLQDRAVLDRWVGEVMANTRAAVDQLVATRVVAAEAALTTALAEQEESDRRELAEGIDGIDARLRELALSRARAAAAREAAAPAIAAALTAVRAELDAYHDSENGLQSR
ncbi:hypothetical protein [Mycolicibacterium mengxianglii]|uniref:hypothetical protein n=1 Tax=Mycolicibacterium mengxianglii TaxID=2736649 RepID=UPI0018EF0A1F|nr:hypothetical protein [Mycolicibacterium mengxianglii]